MIPDILAERYASQAMKDIWSAEGKILLERDLWIAVMKAQKELGLKLDRLDAMDRPQLLSDAQWDAVLERKRQLLEKSQDFRK